MPKPADDQPRPPTTPHGHRWLLGFGAVATIPLVLIVDLGLAIAQGWQSSSSMPDAIFGLFGLILAIAVTIALSRPGRAWYAKRAPALLGLGLSTVLAWTAAEWICGQMFGGQLLFHRHVPNLQSTFHPDPEVMPGIADVAHYTANSQGVRGLELPAEPGPSPRILCVGGSTTACLFLDDQETWPRLLQERLRHDHRQPEAWVGDVGKSGYGSWHHVRFLSQADDLLNRIDTMVVLVGINDFMRALQQRPIYAPLGVVPLYERSNIFAILHNLYQARKQRRQYVQEFADGSSYVRRREARRARPVTETLPDLTAALADYRTNILSIVATCRARDIRPIFVSQPVLWTRSPDERTEALCWLGEVQGGQQLATPALAEGMRQFNDALRTACGEHNATFVDTSILDGDPEIFFDDCHFTEEGARRLAQLLSDALAEPSLKGPEHRSQSANGDRPTVPRESTRR